MSVGVCCVGGGGHGHAAAVECEMECDEHGSGGAGGISQTTPELDCRVSLTHFASVTPIFHVEYRH